MDWYPIFLYSTESEYYQWFEKFSLWVGISEHGVHDKTFIVLTDDTHNFLLLSNLCSTEEPKHPISALTLFVG